MNVNLQSVLSQKTQQYATFIEKHLEVLAHAPLLHMAKAAASASLNRNGRAWTALSSSAEILHATISAPLYLVKDLILTVIAAPFALLALVKKGKCHDFGMKTTQFVKNRIISAGLDLTALFVGIFGIVYPFTPIPKLIKTDKLELGISSGVHQLNGLSALKPLKDTLEWADNNKELVAKLAKHTPEFEALLKLQPVAKPLLEEIQKYSDPKKVHILINTIDRITSGPAIHSFSNINPKPNIFTTLNQSLNHSITAFISSTHMLTNFFVATLCAPSAIFSRKAANFVNEEYKRTNLHANYASTALLGIFAPKKATSQALQVMISSLPNDLRGLTRDTVACLDGNLINSLKMLKETVENNQMSQFLFKITGSLTEIAKENPDVYEKIAQLMALHESNTNASQIKLAATFIDRYQDVEKKNPGISETIATLLLQNSPSEMIQQIPSIIAKHPRALFDFATTTIKFDPEGKKLLETINEYYNDPLSKGKQSIQNFMVKLPEAIYQTSQLIKNEIKNDVGECLEEGKDSISSINKLVTNIANYYINPASVNWTSFAKEYPNFVKVGCNRIVQPINEGVKNLFNIFQSVMPNTRSIKSYCGY